MIPDIGISNGVMSVILNYAKAMPDDIKFDVVYFFEKENTRQADIEALGGKVYKIDPPSPMDLITGKMNGFFAEHKNEWQALHIHCPHFAVFIAPYAKKAGVDKIAMHCHSTCFSLNPKNELRNKVLYKLGCHSVDTRFACGKDAGRFWYGDDKNFIVLPNAVNADKLIYNEEVRKAKRAEMDIEGKLVVGHIGRTNIVQKNHPFLFKIFAEIKKRNENSVLLMAGAEKTPELLNLAEKLQIENDIQFLGQRNDIPEMLQAFDIFVFPSFCEGLPVSVIEAQVAGLPVVMSDSVTDEVVATDKIEMLSLNKSPNAWADKVIELCKNPRTDTFKMIKQNGWDIFDCGKKLAEYYKK